MKAFVVEERVEGCGGLVYADSEPAARRIGSKTYAFGEFNDVTCQRVPEFDKLANDPRAQTRGLLDRGWWFETIDDEIVTSDDEPFVTREGDVYNSPIAWLAHRERQINRSVRDESIRRRWQDHLTGQWWFANEIDIHVEPRGTIVAHIKLPYLLDGVRMIERNDCQHYVTRRDMPAFLSAYRVNKDGADAFT